MNKTNNITIHSYIIGFIVSLFLTVTVYFFVSNKLLASNILIALALVFAVIQLVVQLLFFLHLGKESKPKWNLIFFISTISIVLMVILASIWIMSNLNYHMNTGQMEEYIQSQEGGI